MDHYAVEPQPRQLVSESLHVTTSTGSPSQLSDLTVGIIVTQEDDMMPHYFFFMLGDGSRDLLGVIAFCLCWNSCQQCTRLSDQNRNDLAHRNRSDCAICDCDAHRGPQKSQRFPREDKAMLHCDLRVRWKVASDLRFRAAISEPKTPSFCGISGDLAPPTRKIASDCDCAILVR